MDVYNPEHAVDPVEWNALDELERQYIVEQYHKKKHIKLPNLRMHAIIHVIVENQIAFEKEIPVRKHVERLMLEGLNRHEAIHAIGSILSVHIFDLLKKGIQEQDVNASYFKQLETLTAESWLKSGESEDNDLD